MLNLKNCGAGPRRLQPGVLFGEESPGHFTAIRSQVFMIFRPALRFLTGPFPPGAFAARFLAAVILPPRLFLAMLTTPPFYLLRFRLLPEQDSHSVPDRRRKREHTCNGDPGCRDQGREARARSASKECPGTESLGREEVLDLGEDALLLRQLDTLGVRELLQEIALLLGERRRHTHCDVHVMIAAPGPIEKLHTLAA
jgi:hypothetical protein